VPDLFDKSVRSEPLEQPRNLSAVEIRQMAAKGLILKSADVKLTANDGTQQGFIVAVEQVETGVAAAFPLHWLREFIELVPPRAGIFNGRQELQVTPVGGFQQFAQRRQTVDGFLVTD
jgi:hypothetical protein